MKRRLITARTSFTFEVLDAPARCRGCGNKFRKGQSAYVTRWKNLGRLVRTVLCNLESCWEEWDAEVFRAGHPFDGEERKHDMYEGPDYGI